MTPVPRVEGVVISALRQIADDRGAVLHMLRADSPTFRQFGECYFSEVLPGAVKAWKRHREQTQNIAVPTGRIRFVIYDDRSGSPTRGLVRCRSSSDARMRITRLDGARLKLWYGFSAVELSAGAPRKLRRFATRSGRKRKPADRRPVHSLRLDKVHCSATI